MWGAVAAALVVAALVFWLASTFRTRAGSAQTPAGVPIGGLPAAATDIHYYVPWRPSDAVVYDFRISEIEFVDWAAEHWHASMRTSRRAVPTMVCLNAELEPTGTRSTAGGSLFAWGDESSLTVLSYDRAVGRAYIYDRNVPTTQPSSGHSPVRVRPIRVGRGR